MVTHKNKTPNYDAFVKYTLQNKPRSNAPITLPTNFLVQNMNNIISEAKSNQISDFIRLISVEIDKAEYDFDMTKFNGDEDHVKEFKKLKKDFLYDLKKKVKDIMKN